MEEKLVYVVFHDNGMSYEDNQIYVSDVFENEKDAQACVDDNNHRLRNYCSSMTKAEYYAQAPEDISWDYERFLEIEESNHYMYSDGNFYFTSFKLNTTYEKRK
jgi:hypothetical protein